MKSSTIILKKARKFLSNEKNWCREYLAESEYRGICSPLSLWADRYCARGAVICQAGEFGSEAEELLNEAARQISPSIAEECEESGEYPCAVLNNRCTYPVVMHMFDKAIELAEA